MISMRERRRLQLQIVVALGFVIFTVEKDFFGNQSYENVSQNNETENKVSMFQYGIGY